MISYQFNLEVTPGSMPPILHMAQYDTGRTYTANLKNNGVAFSPTQGSDAKIKGRNAAGVCWEQEATVSGSTVTFTPEGAATDQFGVMPVQLEITHGDDILSTLLVIFNIQKAGYTNEQAASSPEFQTAIQEAVDKALGDSVVFSYAAKSEYLDILEKMAYTDKNGRAAYNALKAELMPPGIVQSITATFTQGSTLVYDYSTLDDLKPMLTVTAQYDSSTSLEVDGYTLSGELAVGTSTITVTYYGKTATFNVTVSVGLDSICYGTKTYRDIFITDNLASWFGDFEDGFTVKSAWTYNQAENAGYRLSGNSAASPSVSTAQFNSAGHSLDVSTSGSTRYINFYSESGQFGVDYIVAYACKMPNYTAGKVELQLFGASSQIVRASRTSVTDGWEPVVAIGSAVKGSNNFIEANFGALALNGTQPTLTAYMDDLVITPKPSGMTLEQATAAMQTYMEIKARGDN